MKPVIIILTLSCFQRLVSSADCESPSSKCLRAGKTKRYITLNETILAHANLLASQLDLNQQQLDEILQQVVKLDDNSTIFNPVLPQPYAFWDTLKSTVRVDLLLSILDELFDIPPDTEAVYSGPPIPSCIPIDNRLEADSPSGKCNFKDAYKYYQIQGMCLNPDKPGAGLAGREMSRIGEPLCSQFDQSSKCRLPSARKVSLALGEIIKQKPQPAVGELVQNMVVLFWYQFVVHETEFQQLFGKIGVMDFYSAPTKSCGHNRRRLPSSLLNPYTPPIDVECDDPFYGIHQVRCLNFDATLKLNEDCAYRRSNLFNGATPSLDLSTVYQVYDLEVNDFLTEMIEDGKLKKDANGDHDIPFHNNKMNNLVSGIAVQIAMMHDLLIDELTRLKPSLPVTKKFKIAQRINIAFSQHIFYHHILPTIIGTNNTVAGSLEDTFDPSVTLQGIQEWATGAGRFFHVKIPDRFVLSDLETFRPLESFKMRDSFGDPFHFVFTRLPELTAGMMYLPWKEDGLTSEVQNHMFFDSHLKYGGDIFSLDVQRNREVCSEPYINYLKRLFGVCVTSWSDLEQFIPKFGVQKLQTLYERVEDVEFYVASDIESKVGDSTMGPTFTRITEMQFENFKNGDPKFYTHALTERERAEIVKMDLKSFFCIVLGLPKVLQDPRFAYLPGRNELEECSCRSLADCFDLSVFLDECD